jgi:MYXO-CTERM domain-containing protein
MVDTPLGPRPIETLRVGDAVWSYDTAENRRVVGSVSHTMRRVAPASLELSVAGQRIQTTAEHPFFEPITKQWVEARELRMGHPVARWSVGELVVDHVRQSVDRPGPVEVFNITVSAHHDYFVEGLLVHNKSPPYSIYTNTEPITPTNNGDTYNTYYDYYSAGDTASSGPTTAPTTDESPEETGGGEGKVDEGDCGCRSAGSGTAGWGLILLGALVRRRRTNQARM